MNISPVATRCALAAGILFGAALPAPAADRWEEAGSGAVAILPAPKSATGITGGSLYCAEQRWAFLFRLAPDSGIAAGTIEKAKLAAGEQTFEADAEISMEAARVKVPSDILAALKDGSGLKVEIGAGKTAPKATFNLRSSKLVIETIAPRCSQIDMSAYQAVALSQTDAAVPVATTLLADEIRLFRAFTETNPAVSTVTMDIAADKRLMFASLCGSTRYFGDSGCSLTGYAAAGIGSDWRMVYETEGMLLYTDPAGTQTGWPDIVTLPAVGGTEAMHWTWAGDQYHLRGEAVSENQDGVQEQGDSVQ